MGYEVFERKVQRAISPTISIVKQGRLVLNKTAADLFQKHGTNYVFLLWDRESRRIGVRPCFKKEDRRAYLVGVGNGSGISGANINAKTFLDHVGVDYTETRAYPASWNDNDGLFEVTLPENVFPVTNERQTTLIGVPTKLRSA